MTPAGYFRYIASVWFAYENLNQGSQVFFL